MSAETTAQRMYIHRRIVVRFLVAVLVVLSALSFASIAFGWGQSSQIVEEDFGTPVRLTDTSPFYVLLIGTDSLEGTALYSGGIDNPNEDPFGQQADAVTLVRVDPSTLTLTLVTIPANTVLYDSDDLLRDSLSEGGPIQTVYTVERITGIDVSYYFMFDFSDFENLMEQVGKVPANVPFTIKMQDPVSAKTITVRQGVGRMLNGPQALAFLRAWEQYETDADAYRQRNVRDMETQVITQVLDYEDEAVRLVLGALEQNCTTDMDNTLLISLVTHFYENKAGVIIYACTGPYLTTAISETGEPIIRQSVPEWRELMTVVDAGEDPAAVLPQYDFKPIDPDDYVVEKKERSNSSSSSKTEKGKGASSSSSKDGANDKAADKAVAEEPPAVEAQAAGTSDAAQAEPPVAVEGEAPLQEEAEPPVEDAG